MNSKTKVLTRKQKKEKKRMDQEPLQKNLTKNQLEILEKELLEKLNSIDMGEELLANLKEKVLEAEACIMKAAELKLKTGRIQTRKEFREEKISKLIDVGERKVPTFKAAYSSKDDINGIKTRLLECLEYFETSGHKEEFKRFSQSFKKQCAKKVKEIKECVELDGRIEIVQELLRKALVGEGVCRNPKCQEVSLHRCSGCLLVSYCSLQCSHLCWQEHRQICTREQAARQIRKEERREKRVKKAKRKSEKVVDEEASKGAIWRQEGSAAVEEEPSGGVLVIETSNYRITLGALASELNTNLLLSLITLTSTFLAVYWWGVLRLGCNPTRGD